MDRLSTCFSGPCLVIIRMNVIRQPGTQQRLKGCGLRRSPLAFGHCCSGLHLLCPALIRGQLPPAPRLLGPQCWPKLPLSRFQSGSPACEPLAVGCSRSSFVPAFEPSYSGLCTAVSVSDPSPPLPHLGSLLRQEDIPLHSCLPAHVPIAFLYVKIHDILVTAGLGGRCGAGTGLMMAIALAKFLLGAEGEARL